jgi:sulfotransferase
MGPLTEKRDFSLLRHFGQCSIQTRRPAMMRRRQQLEGAQSGLLPIAIEIPMTISPLKPRFVGLTGLPRAGSTLLSQLLAQHPDIHCDGASSPLCNMLLGIRRMVSDDTFFLAQLDSTFDASYGHLASAMRGFLQSWHHDAQSSVVVDKNRAWLHAVELLLHIEPEARLIVCLRELGQIYGSIEAQHQRTILVDFIDHLADFDRFGRADMLFAKDKVIGAPLISIHAVPDLPTNVLERLYFVRFEDLMDRPAACLSHICSWLGVTPLEINLESLTVGTQESDSHYRMKYLHRQSNRLVKPARHEIPARIQKQIESAYAWFYQTYYPKPA